MGVFAASLAGLMKGLPAFAGVVLGIFLFGWDWSGAPLFVLIALTGLAIIAVIAGHALMRYPYVALGLFQVWLVSVVIVTALVTAFVMFVSISAEHWFGGDDRGKLIGSALIGAVTAYLAAIWLDGIKDSTGPFLPGAQFKMAMARLAKPFETPARSAEMPNDIYAHCTEEKVVGGPGGWEFGACLKRAAAIDAFMKARGRKL